MTAAVRPKVIERTFQSIISNLKCDDSFRLIVDIADIGEIDKYSVLDISDIVNQHFPNNLIRRKGKSLQAEALKWTWSQSESEFVLQWEDDWVLRDEVDLDIILSFMRNGRKYAGMIYFDRYGKSVFDYPGYKDKFIRHSKWFWNRIKEKSLGGPPAVLRRQYIQDILPIIDGNVCLDILSREPQAQSIINRWEVFVYSGDKGNLVEDIGKEWKEKQGIRMIKRSDKGVSWIKK